MAELTLPTAIRCLLAGLTRQTFGRKVSHPEKLQPKQMFPGKDNPLTRSPPLLLENEKPLLTQLPAWGYFRPKPAKARPWESSHLTADSIPRGTLPLHLLHGRTNLAAPWGPFWTGPFLGQRHLAVTHR